MQTGIFFHISSSEKQHAFLPFITPKIACYQITACVLISPSFLKNSMLFIQNTTHADWNIFSIFTNKNNSTQKNQHSTYFPAGLTYSKNPFLTSKCPENVHSLHSNCFEPFIYMHACNKFTYCMLYNRNLDMQTEISIQFHY